MNALDHLVDFAALISSTVTPRHSQTFANDHQTFQQHNETKRSCEERLARSASIPENLYDTSSSSWTGKQEAASPEYYQETSLATYTHAQENKSSCSWTGKQEAISPEYYRETLPATYTHAQENLEKQEMRVDNRPQWYDQANSAPYPNRQLQVQTQFTRDHPLSAIHHYVPQNGSLYLFEGITPVSNEAYAPYPPPSHVLNHAEEARRLAMIDRRSYEYYCSDPRCGCLPLVPQAPHTADGHDQVQSGAFWYADPANYEPPTTETHNRWADMRMSEEQMRATNAQRY
ncbi:hypothetical protein CC86DRAFT_188588 [Ophiobolus disseminans]|uniref:Uncharacterized protein n=1 Tax=Ophiobolus disseminans TaxID=1469910 RepID=A0A6A7A842_9PLEO|nr:hypothetical protein CC86DRAFT_188588 [Ophiobolus disseminans]